MTTSRQLAVHLSFPTYAIGQAGNRALCLIGAIPPESLTEKQRLHQANNLIGGVRRFLSHRPEFQLLTNDEEMSAFAKKTGGFGNVWVKSAI